MSEEQTTLTERMTGTYPQPKRKRMNKQLATIPTGTELNQAKEPSVALMLQSVIDKGITAENVTALEALVGLYDRMQAKDAEKQFNEAFVKMRGALPKISATKPVPNNDGSIRYRYAPLEEIEALIRPVALEHGFTYSFSEGGSQPGRITKILTIYHVGGHSRSNPFSVRVSAPPKATDSQADGSTHSYAKRGAFCDGFGVIVDHDDDARMVGHPVSKEQAASLLERVKNTGSSMVSFLKYAGVTLPAPDQLDNHDPIEFFEQISEDRYESLDEILRRKEGKLI